MIIHTHLLPVCQEMAQIEIMHAYMLSGRFKIPWNTFSQNFRIWLALLYDLPHEVIHVHSLNIEFGLVY